MDPGEGAKNGAAIPWAGPPGIGLVCYPMPQAVAVCSQMRPPAHHPSLVPTGGVPVPQVGLAAAYGYMYPSAELMMFGFTPPPPLPRPAGHVLPVPKRPVARRSGDSLQSYAGQPGSSVDSFGGHFASLSSLPSRSESLVSLGTRNDSVASLGTRNDSVASLGTRNDSVASIGNYPAGSMELPAVHEAGMNSSRDSLAASAALHAARLSSQGMLGHVQSMYSSRGSTEAAVDWVGQIEIDKEGLWNRERIILGVKAVLFKGIMCSTPREREEVRRRAQEWCGDTALLDTIMKRCPNRSFEGFKVIRESRSGRYVYSLARVHYSGPASLMGSDLVPCRKRKR